MTRLKVAGSLTRSPIAMPDPTQACHDPVVSAGTRLLIATGEVAADVEELPPLVRVLIQAASEIVVMTPVLVSRLAWLASDTDRARFEADERLSAVLGHVETL